MESAQGSEGTDGRWRIARKVAPERVISTVDPEARHTRKSTSVRKDGYRRHVAAEPETGLITDCQLTQAAGSAGSGPVLGEAMISRDRYRQTGTPSATIGRPHHHDQPADHQPADQDPAGSR